MASKHAHASLEAAKAAASARAKEEAAKAPQLSEVDLDAEECLVQLAVESFASGLRMGMGTMPDGMAIWMRLSMPSKASSAYAGLVAFLISDDPLTVLRKAVAALEAPPKPPFWKPDQFARPDS